jgi:hypothetical protein
MKAPAGIFAGASGRVYVADSSNHRVLVFTPPFTNGMSATAVFGQANLTSCAANAVAQSGRRRSATRAGVFEDADGTVFIADSGNNRVLVYDPPFGAATSSPDAVMGQANFTSTLVTSPAPNTLYQPQAVTMDGNRNLFIADGGELARHALRPRCAADRVARSDSPIRSIVGDYNGLTGSGFTAGSVVILFIRVNGTVTQFGPYTRPTGQRVR